jgi:O-antigen/teichoic acid export membrane protein
VFGVYFVVYAKFGLPGVIAGQAAGAWLGTVVTLFALRGVFSIRAVDKARLAPMLRLSAPLVLMTNLTWLMGGAVSYFITFVCSREDAGLYQVANSLASILGLLFFAFDQAWAPIALSIRDVPIARRVYGVTVEAAFVLGLLLAFTAAVFARPALLVITNPLYVRAEWVLGLLALNVALMNIPSVLSVTFAREKMTMPLAKATAGGASVTVVLVPLLARSFGKEGAAFAVLLGTITILTLSFRASQRVFPIDVRLPRAGVAMILTAVWAVAFLLSRPFVTSIPSMIGHGALLVLSLAGTITVIYRAPLREAWLASRPAIPSKS